MKILQQPVKVKRGSRVIVKISQPSIVYLMTEVNFKKYKEGSAFRRMGGKYDQGKAEFVAPYDGTWHAVIEKGSHYNPTNVNGTVEVLPPKRKEMAYFNEKEEWEKDNIEAIAAKENAEMEERHDDLVDQSDATDDGEEDNNEESESETKEEKD